MSRVFHPYTEWEDWQSGMWTPTFSPRDVEKARQILADPKMFLSASQEMVADWVKSAEQNLTDKSQNRRSWVGQAACCHLSGIPEQATRLAWWSLSLQERAEANEAADTVIAEWEARRKPQMDLFWEGGHA